MNEHLERLTAQLRQVAALPIGQARSLPGVFYTDAAFFSHECDRMMRRAWHCLGRVDEIPNPGDYFTVRLLEEPLLVIRGDEGEIRVLSNLCRHRGMTLLQGLWLSRLVLSSRRHPGFLASPGCRPRRSGV